MGAADRMSRYPTRLGRGGAWPPGTLSACGVGARRAPPEPEPRQAPVGSTTIGTAVLVHAARRAPGAHPIRRHAARQWRGIWGTCRYTSTCTDSPRSRPQSKEVPGVTAPDCPSGAR